MADGLSRDRISEDSIPISWKTSSLLFFSQNSTADREMGIRHQKNSDRLRTIWTPEMDRYFIDLMLEQVGKGNRIDDHLFSKRAWKHMTLLFNTKFKFHYEKDVLKNRHKTLRNLYRAINNLLSLNGFSWDQTRQMVTADNNVWDDYIKVHPEARSYRIKTIPYYYDLCQIYKYISTEGNSDENPEGDCKALGTEGEECLVKSVVENETGNADLEVLHEIMIDEDFRVSKEFGDGIPESEQDMGRSRARTYWQPPMDRYFIDLMVDQVQKGNQIDGLFRKQAWIEMIKSFNARFGFKYDVDILKNRYKTFKRQYNTIKKLLESEGFFWDDLRQMVIADDRAWQDYIEANSDARQYMTRPVPYYKDLCSVCKEVNTIDGRESLSDNHSNQNQKDEAGFLKLTHSATVSDEQESSHKRQLENKWNSEHLKKARMDEESMASALREMATAVSYLADKMKDDDDDDDNNSSNSIAVVKAIQGLPDMDEDLILDACDLLEDDDKKAKTFLALDVKLRRKWLIRKLRPQHSSI